MSATIVMDLTAQDRKVMCHIERRIEAAVAAARRKAGAPGKAKVAKA